MEKDIQKVNEELIKFWDDAIKLNEEYKQAYLNEEKNYEDIVPSEKLLNAVKELGKCHRVLDYGCGNAWGAVTAAKNGCKNVLAVDLGEGLIETANFFKDLYEVNDLVKTEVVKPDWISGVETSTFDGLVCSNVLDVVPLETAENLVKEMHRICKKNAMVVIGLNFYMSPKMTKERNIDLVDGRYLFVNDVLRLSSLSDLEWEKLFTSFFEVVKLDYFAWPGEKKESRRLFILKNK